MDLSKSLAWLSGILFYLYQYIVRASPKVFLVDITQKFNITENAFGQFSGAYYLSYSLAHIPIGIILDRYNIKKTIPIFIILTSIGLAPIIYSDSFYMSIFGRIITGIGSSAAILGLFKIVRMCFEENKFSRIMSISVTIGLLGAVYAGEPLSIINSKIGFISLIEIIMISGIMLGALTFFMLPSSKKNNTNKSFIDTINSAKQVFFNMRIISVFCLAGLMVGPLEGFADVWGPAFLQKVMNMDQSTSQHISSLIFYGMIAGQILIVLVAEKTGKYINTIVFSGVVMALTFVPMLFNLTNNVMIISICMAICGALCGYQMLAIYIGSSIASDENRTLASAIGNMMIMIFGYFFHTIIGSTLTLGSVLFSDEIIRWKLAIGTIPICLLIGSLGFMVIGKNTKA